MRYNLKSLIEYLKEEFGAINGQISDLRSDFTNLQTSVERIVVKTAKHEDELKAINHRIDQLPTKEYMTDFIDQKFDDFKTELNIPLRSKK